MFVDTSGIYASLDRSDENHAIAATTMRHLLRARVRSLLGVAELMTAPVARLVAISQHPASLRSVASRAVTDPRVSQRAQAIPPFRVVAVMEEAWALERSGRSIIRLLAGEPDFGTPAPVVQAVNESIATGRVHYTGSMGVPDLRDAISRMYTERFGVAVPAERIVVTTGASGALLLALAATVDRDQEILLTDPGYPCNASFVRLFEGRGISIAVGAETNYQLTARLVEDHWTENTAGALVATPANPTGAVVEPAELAAIAAVVRGRHGVLLVDEIYGELVYDRTPSTILATTDEAFVFNSFSKTFGMTGWRLGWMVCPDWALDAVERLAQNLYISPPAAPQAGAIAALTPEVWDEVEHRRQTFHQRRDELVDGLRALGFRIPVVPQGAFYVYADCSALADDSSALAHRLLHEAGVAVTPGDDFGSFRADEHLRFSYTASIEDIRTALDRMALVLGT